MKFEQFAWEGRVYEKSGTGGCGNCILSESKRDLCSYIGDLNKSCDQDDESYDGTEQENGPCYVDVTPSNQLPERRDMTLRDNAGSSESIRAIMAGLRRICEIMGEKIPLEDCVVVDSAEYAALRDVEKRARSQEIFREQLDRLDRIRHGLGGVG